MKISQRLVVLAAVTVLLPSLSLALAQEQGEKTIQRSDLPLAVQKTVAREKSGYSIRGYSEETANGQILYEVKFNIPGSFHKTDKSLTMDADGSVVEVEEWTSQYSLPREVLQGLKAQAGGGKIVKYKTITKSGQLVAYAAKVMTNGKTSEVQVGPNGIPLDHEE